MKIQIRFQKIQGVDIADEKLDVRKYLPTDDSIEVVWVYEEFCKGQI